MSLIKITLSKKILAGIFSDKSLSKKASLNALTSSLDYLAQLLVGFIITPMMVAGLGDYFYGVWQILNRMFAYFSTRNGVSSPMEMSLTKDQTLDNYDEKRRYIGSAIVVWGIFLPITGAIGGLITWFSPYLLDTPAEFFWQIRIVAALFVGIMATAGLSFMPYAILRGQNQGYRRIGLSVLVFFFNGGLTWVALYLKTGIIGVSISVFIQQFITFFFYVMVCRSYIPWFGIQRPSFDMVKRFLGLSWWYLAGDVVSNVIFSSDVVVLGLLNSVESVTSYTLTKYIPETVITIIAIVVVGIIPGLGGILGAGDYKKASQVRGEIFSLSWLIITAIGTSILLWNRSFLGLWVGSDRYAGVFQNYMIVLVVAQFVLIRTDGFIIDLTLRIQRKVLYGAISALVSVILSGIFVKFFDLGVIGVCLGLILGRSILSITYPILVSRFIKDSMLYHVKNIVRPALVTIVLFTLASFVDRLTQSYVLSGISGWIILIIGAGISALAVLLFAFYAGLPDPQRKKIAIRLKALIATRESG
jgi:O-antigen/teichoic acid export membrane protein